MKKALRISTKTILLMLMVFHMHAGRAQIIYTCLTPAVKVSASVQESFKRYDIDIDRDNTPDIYLKHFHPDSSFQNVEFYCTDNLAEVLVDSNTLEPLVFKNNDTIQAAGMLWYNTLVTGGNEALFMDNKWAGVNDGYIGLRIRKGTVWRYAWLRLSIPANESSFTVTDYAYESTGKFIIAGTGKTGIGHVSQQSSSVNIYYHEGIINVSGINCPVRSTMEIWNTKGQLIRKTEMPSAGKYDVHDLQPGTYVVRFYNNSQYAVQKIIVY